MGTPLDRLLSRPVAGEASGDPLDQLLARPPAPAQELPGGRPPITPSPGPGRLRRFLTETGQTIRTGLEGLVAPPEPNVERLLAQRSMTRAPADVTAVAAPAPLAPEITQPPVLRAPTAADIATAPERVRESQGLLEAAARRRHLAQQMEVAVRLPGAGLVGGENLLRAYEGGVEGASLPVRLGMRVVGATPLGTPAERARELRAQGLAPEGTPLPGPLRAIGEPVLGMKTWGDVAEFAGSLPTIAPEFMAADVLAAAPLARRIAAAALERGIPAPLVAGLARAAESGVSAGAGMGGMAGAETLAQGGSLSQAISEATMAGVRGAATFAPVGFLSGLRTRAAMPEHVQSLGSQQLEEMHRAAFPDRAAPLAPEESLGGLPLTGPAMRPEPSPVSAPPPSAPAPAPEAAAAPTPTEPLPVAPPAGIVRMPVSDIRMDPDRFQFKQLGTEGVSSELKGVKKFNEKLAGVVSVWRDPADGQVYVVNGHHRLELAKRLGQRELNVQFLDAPNATEARAEGAFINIAEGRGTATDVAKFLRDAKATPADLEARGVTLRSDLSRDGLALSRLAPDVFDQVATAKIPQGWGVAIGSLLHAPELQREAVQAARSGKRLSQAEVLEIARQVRDAGTEAVGQETLFGTETQRRALFVQKAQLANQIKRRLATDRRLFGFVSKEGRAEQLGRAGRTQIDVGAAKELAGLSDRSAEIFDRLYTRSGPIADLVTEGARRIAHGETARSAAARIYPEIGAAVRAELESAGVRPDVRQPPAAESARSVADELAAEPTEGPVADSQDERQNALFERQRGYLRDEQAVLGSGRFYSRLERAIERSKFDRAPAQTWINKLRGNQSSAEEFDTALGEALRADPQRRWTKAELLDLAKGRGYGALSETVRGKYVPEAEAVARTSEVQRGIEARHALLRAAEQQGVNQINRANLMTHVVTPVEGRTIPETLRFFGVEATPRNVALAEEIYRGQQAALAGAVPAPKYTGYTVPGGTNQREILIQHPSAKDFQGGHYPEEGVLTHVRLNDRVVNGEKTLFIEEIQSDLHQQGRKMGYQGDVLPFAPDLN